MNIATVQGEKSVKTLAKRLLAEPTKETAKTTQAEMEASLLRLNPQLADIGSLEKGAAVIVPDGFGLDPAESTAPMRSLADILLQRAESALADLQVTLKDQSAREAERTDRAVTWLKSDQASALARQSPELKSLFADAGSGTKTLPKEQAAVVTKESKALEKVATQLQDFRTSNLRKAAAGTAVGIIKRVG